MKSLLQEVEALVLQGLWPAEIKTKLSEYSERTVRQYCHVIMSQMDPETKAKVEALRLHRGKPKGGVKEFFKRRPLGEKHIILGSRIYDLRKEMKLNHTEFAEHFTFTNRLLLSTMEQGYHDFTLTELLRLSDILELSLEALLNPKEVPDDLSFV